MSCACVALAVARATHRTAEFAASHQAPNAETKLGYVIRVTAAESRQTPLGRVPQGQIDCHSPSPAPESPTDRALGTCGTGLRIAGLAISGEAVRESSARWQTPTR